MGRTGKTQQDWVKAGQQLLIDGGIDAVKLNRLTCLLKVSTGSFYHHFANFDHYLAVLAEVYGKEQAQLPFDQARGRIGEDPALLLREATTIFGQGSMRQLNVAMRAWAQHDQRAFDAVRRYDEVLMNNLDQLFRSLGFDELAAKSRTVIMMGLATLEFDPNIMTPSYAERWFYIRDHIMLPRES